MAVAPEYYARLGDLSKMTDVKQIIADVISKAPDAQCMADADSTVAWAVPPAAGAAAPAAVGAAPPVEGVAEPPHAARSDAPASPAMPCRNLRRLTRL